MKLGEANALAVQPVQIGRFDDGIPVSGYVAIPLIVRKHNDDVGRLRRLTRHNGNAADGGTKLAPAWLSDFHSLH